MKKLLVILFLLIPVLKAQNRDMLFMHNGKSAMLYLTVAPETGETIQIFRSDGQTGGDMKLLNENNLLKRLDNPYSVSEYVGEDYPELKKYLDAENDFEVYRAITGNSSRAALATLVFPGAAAAAGRAFIDSTAAEGRTYTYKIVYLDGDRNVAEFTKTVRVVKSIVAPPNSLKAEFKRGVVTLNWAYPSWESDKSNLAIQFRVYKKGEVGKFMLVNPRPIIRNDAAQPEFSTSVSADETETEYYVTAVDPIGNESNPSISVKVKTVSDELPEKPDNAEATAGEGFINIVWKNASQTAISGFNIYRKENLDNKPVKLNSTIIPPNTPFYTDTTIRSGVMFYYLIAAVSKGGKEGKLSNVAATLYDDKTPPEMPSDLLVKMSGKYVKLEWKKSISKDVKGYGIYKGTTPGILARIAVAVGLSYIDTGYTKEGFEAGGKYYYSVSAVDRSNNESEKLTEIKFTYVDKVAPELPSPFNASIKNGKEIEIVSGNSISGDIAKVNVYKLTPGPKAKAVLLTSLSKLPIKLIDSSVVLGKKYVYSVELIDTAGNKSKMVSTDTVLFKTLFPPPMVPYVSAVKKQNGTIIKWVAVIKDDLAGYNIYRSDIATGVYQVVNIKPVKGIEYIDKPGREGIFYKVTAVDISGNESEPSEYAPVFIGE